MEVKQKDYFDSASSRYDLGLLFLIGGIISLFFTLVPLAFGVSSLTFSITFGFLGLAFMLSGSILIGSVTPKFE